MSLTPEQFLERAAADKAMREQMKATNTQVTPDTLKGCVMALVQLAHALKMKREDVAAMLSDLIEQMIQRDVAIIAKLKGLP